MVGSRTGETADGPARIRLPRSVREDAAPEAGTGAMSDDPIRAESALAAWHVVVAVVLYVILLAALRVGLSPFLEIDEAQFVGAVDLRLVYGNSHPPLYNWLVRGALEATGWRWALAVALVKMSLLCATYLLVFDAARRLAGLGAGVLALSATAFLPQVSWMSAHTLAHSVLVMAAAAGVVDALARIAVRPDRSAFLWLGVAAGVGALGKFNMFLLLGPLAVALATDPFWRARLATSRALLAPAALAVLAGPALAAAASHVGASTGRLAKLYKDGPFAAIDLPYVGVDGVLSLALSAVASFGIVAVLIALFGRTAPDLGPAAGAVRRVLWHTMAIGLGGFALVAFVSDLSLVHERYLTPLLLPLALVAALHLAHWAGRGRLVLAASVGYVAVPVGIAGMTAFDDHRFARPYDALAAPVAAAAPDGRIAVTSWREDLAANMTLALQRAGRDAAMLRDPLAPPADLVVSFAKGRDGSPEPPAGTCTLATVTAAAPRRNLTGRTADIVATISRRCD